MLTVCLWCMLICTFMPVQLWPHLSSLHIITHLIGYFCAQSEATIWLHRRQPVLDRPGHKALKANWLIALAVHFQCHLFGLTQVKHKWRPDPVCTNICCTWSWLISQRQLAYKFSHTDVSWVPLQFSAHFRLEDEAHRNRNKYLLLWKMPTKENIIVALNRED